MVPAAGQDQSGDSCIEMDFPAARQDGFPDGGNDFGQPVGTDMGMGIHQDVWIGPVLYQQGHDLPDIAPFGGPGVEFSVTVSAGPAFAETVVGIRITDPVPVDGFQVEWCRSYS